MYIEQFQYFVEVANTKSMSIAANNLHVTQQNISKSIKQLETELNVQLFIRSTNGVFLTEIGKSVYNDVLEILTQINYLEVKYKENNLNMDKAGDLSILSIYGLGHLHMELSKIIMNTFPNYTFNIYETDTILCNKLLDDEKHAIITMQTDNLDEIYANDLQNRYYAFLVKTDKLRLQVSARSPIAKQNNVSLNSLTYLPLIAYCSEGVPPYFFNVLERHGIKVKPAFTTNNLFSAQFYLDSGSAYGLTTKYIYNVNNAFSKNCTLIPLNKKIEIYYVVLLNKINSQFQECVELLHESLKIKYDKLY